MHPLKQWREHQKLTQKEAAERLGLTPTALCRYENGTRKPSLTKAVELSEQTGIPTEEFAKAS